MDGSKRVLAILIVLLTAFTVPAHAQYGGDPMGMDPYAQGMSYGSPYYGWGGQGTSYGSPYYGWGGQGTSYGNPYNGMGWQGMPYTYPGTGTGLARQADPALTVTRLVPEYYQKSGKDLMATIESMPQLSMFAAALKAAGYDEKLRGEGKYLVFAPLDKAIQRDMAINSAQSLAANPGLARGLAENCIVYQADGQGSRTQNITAVNGKQIVMIQLRSGITANGADVSKIVTANNGMLVVTDGAVGT